MRRLALILLALSLSALLAAPVVGQSPALSPSPAVPSPAAVPSPVTVTDGTFIVGVDLPAGTYRSDGGPTCYWARLSGFTGESTDIIANDNPAGPAVVTIEPTDIGFQSKTCGLWTEVLPVVASVAPGPLALSPTLHGVELMFTEMAMPGTLERNLNQFAKAWNREVGGYGSEFKMPTKPKVEKGANGARSFEVDFKMKGPYGDKVEGLSVFGRLDPHDKLTSVTATWFPVVAADELESSSDELNAVLMLSSFPMAVDPNLTSEQRNALLEVLGFPKPDQPFTGIEEQASFDGVVYTLMDDGTTVDLIARRE